MKKFLALLVILMMSFTAAACAEVQREPDYMSLIQPSRSESTIAAGRDFYVIVKITPAIAEDVVGADVRLIDSDGEICRRVYFNSDPIDFNVGYELLEAYNEAQDQWLMPELVYDPADSNSFAYPWNKCYVKDGYVAAYITGGLYDGHIRHINEDGTQMEELAPGKYKIEINLTVWEKEEENKGDEDLEYLLLTEKIVTKEYDITLGKVQDKTLSRFYPSQHFDRVRVHSAKLDSRIYMDLFPGYWSPAGLFNGAEDSGYFSEIKRSWQFADGLEYRSGRVNMYLYNISPTSASQTVEFGILQTTRAFAEGRVTMYGYDIGEPSITYINFDGEEKTLPGVFEEIPADDGLFLYRMEIKNEESDDNLLQVYEAEEKEVVRDLSEPIDVKAGQYVAFVGAVPPFQNEDKDIIPLDDNTYKIVNHTETLKYTFTRNDVVIMTGERDTGLDRSFEEDWTGLSIYEFSNVFEVTEDMEGEVTVNIEAFDVYGEPVLGGSETLVLNVTK